MKQKHKQMLDEALESLNLLDIKNDQIMVVGSIALDICGLFPKYRLEAHDVDVVVKATPEEQNRIAKMIKVINDVNKTSNKVLGSSDCSCYVLNLKNVVLNIWFYHPDASFNTEIKLENGVWVERPVDCFNKKKSYGRPKDFRDLNNIATMYIL